MNLYAQRQNTIDTAISQNMIILHFLLPTSECKDPMMTRTGMWGFILLLEEALVSLMSCFISY